MILPHHSHRVPGGFDPRPLIIPGYVFTRDGPGNVIVPLSNADWTTGLGLPAPLYQWNCQEASGDLASAIGLLNLVVAGPGTSHVYQQAVTGWTRGFVGFSAETGK